MSGFVKIDNLKCGYPSGFMLNSICFDIKKGSFAGIIGPNGSGKTTLFKAITGEIPVIGGSISINSIDTSTMSAKQKARKIAIVTQNTEAADITVEDYVLMGRMPYKKHFQLFETDKDYEVANRFMELTGVLKFKQRLMYELSGGEQQLAAIARALTQEPELLLLDEPTSHLDIAHQMQVLNLIQQLNSDLDITVLMVIHDLNLAAEFCNYLVMMDSGKIFVKGEPKEVLKYDNIETVYKTVVVTHENPLSKKPIVLLVSANTLNNLKNKG